MTTTPGAYDCALCDHEHVLESRTERRGYHVRFVCPDGCRSRWFRPRKNDDFIKDYES